jgi:hypothetical protein
MGISTQYIQQKERYYHDARKGQHGRCRIYESCPCGCGHVRWRYRVLTFYRW